MKSERKKLLKENTHNVVMYRGTKLEEKELKLPYLGRELSVII